LVRFDATCKGDDEESVHVPGKTIRRVVEEDGANADTTAAVLVVSVPGLHSASRKMGRFRIICFFNKEREER
jgi:hypothetical protein